MDTKAIRSATVMPASDSIATIAAGRALIQQRNSKGRNQQFPDHASYLRYIAGANIIRSRRLPTPVPSVTVPNPPTDVSAVAGDSEATVSFTPPTNNGGAAITSYTVTSSPDAVTATGAASPLTVTGLTNDTAYTFTVVATNSIGNSQPSAASAPVTPSGGGVITSPTVNNGAQSVTPTPASPVGGAAYQFNGTSNYLSVDVGSRCNFGTGDFTIEWFQYQTDSNSFPRIFEIGSYLSGTIIGCSIEGGTFYAWVPGFYDFGNPTPYKNTWIHFAIVRNAGVLRVYRNGTQIGSDYSNTNNISNPSLPLYIGVENGGADPQTYFGGYLTNIRIVKGVAVYTSNFSPITTPLTIIPGTVLLFVP